MPTGTVTPAHVGDIVRLKDAGLRVTAPRLAVLEALRALDHPSVDAVTEAVRERLGAVSTQAVYDILGAFTAAGFVRRIEPAGSPALFEGRVDDNHHHLICRVCGSVADVDCATGHAPCLTPSERAGFLVDEAEVIYWGVCPSCQGARVSPEGGKAHA
ncbi:MAG: transcriptional repressor [Actinobacteria bacterium]|nr:transcriptional repressor [Actinomycetota bacterium]